MDFSNNQPISNAKIYFALYTRGTGLLGGGSYDIQNYLGLSDAQGRFSYSYIETNSISERAVVALGPKEKYFTEMSIVGTDTLKAHLNNKRQDIDFAKLSPNQSQQSPVIKLMPKAYLKIHVKNIQPFNSYDEISISGNTFLGTQVDTVFNSNPVEGNKSNTIYYIFIKKGIQKNLQKEIYTPSFDTTLVEINY